EIINGLRNDLNALHERMNDMQRMLQACMDVQFELQRSSTARSLFNSDWSINSGEPHFAALKRILRYVRGTMDFGLQLYVFATTSLVGYTDVDWAGCPSTRSTKAECRGVTNVVAETAWIRNLLRELHSPLSTATLVYCDNGSAVYMSVNHVQHQRTKHIEIDIHFVRDMVTAGHVRVLHVPSRFQYADIFTKGLPTALFEDFRSSLRVRPPPAQTAGAY
ncbi:ribonuclease H-like domain-containing protein, partial [Tanacetum coccineum]